MFRGFIHVFFMPFSMKLSMVCVEQSVCFCDEVLDVKLLWLRNERDAKLLHPPVEAIAE